MVRGRRRLGFEIKRTPAPRTTKSLHAARETLGLDEVVIVHAGESSFPLGEGIRAVAFTRIRNDLSPL